MQTERLTRWEGRDPDGTPRAVLAQHDGLFAEILQPVLRKLANYEDQEEIEMQKLADKRKQGEAMIAAGNRKRVLALQLLEESKQEIKQGKTLMEEANNENKT